MHSDDARKTIEEIKKNKIDFQCRLCGSTEYRPQYQNDGLVGSGCKVWITHFVCGGCGVHFSNPKSFSKKP